MAAMIETPAQFERDLRSAHKGWKRGKDSREKWAHGHRPAAGLKWNHLAGEMMDTDAPEILLTKSRPIKKHSDYVHDSRKKHANSMKIVRPQPTILRAANGRPSGRIGARGEAEDPEASRSIMDLLVPAARKEGSAGAAAWGFHSMDGVLYSFDAAETPSRPLALEAFVKAGGAGRTTEKLVEKEYEIVDANGELLKGRRARSDLRKSASGGVGGVAAAEEDDDGFELV